MPPITSRAFDAIIVMLVLSLVAVEPALANKFETISGGVSGSFRIKREWLQGFLAVAGGVFLLLAVLAVIVPHNNPLLVNFRTWKQSAAIALVLGLLCLGGSQLV